MPSNRLLPSDPTPIGNNLRDYFGKSVNQGKIRNKIFTDR
ncbi:hypothetical protein OH687_24805 [Burkholderia anthina]|nr:hypothetical protein OH687_24805 [Burkholderia anthina]